MLNQLTGADKVVSGKESRRTVFLPSAKHIPLVSCPPLLPVFVTCNLAVVLSECSTLVNVHCVDMGDVPLG